jgi:CelD/BcsL family acetyltransferase involved in cellulose biosynthesis
MASDIPGTGEAPSVASLGETFARACANLVGVIAVVAGLWLAIDLFSAIYRGLNSPENVRPLLQNWAETLGGEKLTVKVGDERYPLAALVATVVVGAGCCVLTWLAMGVMLTGAKIITWTSSDREAIRRILQHALGPGREKQ